MGGMKERTKMEGRTVWTKMEGRKKWTKMEGRKNEKLRQVWSFSFVLRELTENWREMSMLFLWLDEEERDGRGVWHEWGTGEVRTGFWWGNLRERDQMEDPRRKWEDNINVASKSGMEKNGLNWSVWG
jgi:hypothetical protein